MASVTFSGGERSTLFQSRDEPSPLHTQVCWAGVQDGAGNAGWQDEEERSHEFRHLLGREAGGSLLQGEIPGLGVNIRNLGTLGTAQKVGKSGGAGDGGRWQKPISRDGGAGLFLGSGPPGFLRSFP